jgi:hypothetical protein
VNPVSPDPSSTRERRPRWLVVRQDSAGICAITFGSLALFAIGVWLAIIEQNAYWISRSGAAIVAVTVLISFLQFRRDEALQEGWGAVERVIQETFERDLLLLGRERALEESAALREHYRKRSSLVRRNLLVVLVVGTFIGTLLHGFGDLLGGLAGIGGHH